MILPSLPVTAIGKVHKQTLKLDITRRAVEEVVRGLIGADRACRISLEPHPLHGLEVLVHVPLEHVGAVREALSAFSFRSTIRGLDHERSA